MFHILESQSSFMLKTLYHQKDNLSFKRFTLLLIIALLISCRFYGQDFKKTNFSTEGRIDHFGDGLLIGAITNNQNKTVILDTIFVRNDIFKHECYIPNKQIITYRVGDDRFARYRKVVKDRDSVSVDFADERLKLIEIVASAGSKVKVDGIATTYLNAFPSGNIENQKLAILNNKKYLLIDQWSNLDYTDKNNIKTVLQTEEKLSDSIAMIENNVIKTNPASIISSYIILQKIQSLKKNNSSKTDSLLSLLQPQKDDIYYQTAILLQQSLLHRNEIGIGDTFPDFQTKLIYKDSMFTLNQTLGKYRLIDFWGTWCIPCIREMPKLKQFYEKHKRNLSIIGVANDNYQNWKAFLDKNTYSWIQLLDQEPIKLSDKINVQVYPTKYLLDPSGKVLMIFKDSNVDVWNNIEKLLQ